MGTDEEQRGRMRATGWRVPLGTAIAAAAVGLLLVSQMYGSAPPLPWTAIPTLLLLAAGEGIAAFHTRRRIRRVPGTEPVEPLSAARLVALAKASILVAALTAGAFAGTALYLVLAGRLAAPLPRQDFAVAAGSFGAALLLLAAAYLLERACRVPGDGDGGDGPAEGGRPGAA